MYFRVIFQNKDLFKKIIQIEAEPIGLKALDEARQEIGFNFDAKFMKDEVSRYNSDTAEVPLTEEQARRTGLFENNTREKVIVALNSLSRFIKKRLYVERDESNGAILRVEYYRVLDSKEVFEAWLADGCPLEWNP